MVSLRAPYLAAGELAGRIYPRLAHLTLESPNAFRALSIDACLPALTHLTHLALKLRNRLQPELDHLQAALPHLDATQVSRSGRFYHRGTRCVALSAMVAAGLVPACGCTCRVWPRTLERLFREAPELAPYVL